MNFYEKTTKKISFNYIVNVILIPCSKEMDVEMKTLLWWNNKELKWFGLSAMDELETFLLYNNHLTRKQAMKYLYQPGYIDN
jgi:hypothetical protein